MPALAFLFAVLSIWEYPARQPTHDLLKAQFVQSVRTGDTATMEKVCRKGVDLLPDDPTWRYNLACSLAYFDKRQKEALDTLEEAIDLGFRDADAIAKDSDLARLANEPRFKELVEYAKEISTRRILQGPLAAVDATGVFGHSIALGEQNFSWDFDSGCFVARLKLAVASAGGNTGDLYVNRDGHHSALNVKDFPGITEVLYDKEAQARGVHKNVPQTIFPYPVFGNCSMGNLSPRYWRSLPRAMVTNGRTHLRVMQKLYLSNQVWFFPSVFDTAPVGTNGDLFASVTPYWLVTAGRSYSDQPYLRAALEASRSLQPMVKREIVSRNMLAPTIQVLLRKSLGTVKNEDDYLTERAHPTALPPSGIDVRRLAQAALALTADAVPPLAPIRVFLEKPASMPDGPELTYATTFAWAFIVRTPDVRRSFVVEALGSDEYAFVQTHGKGLDVKVERLAPNKARVSFNSRALSPTNRLDLTVVAKTATSGWGAPSTVSFSAVDASAPYSDPVLTLPKKTMPVSAASK